jgi:hypothetical protein
MLDAAAFTTGGDIYFSQSRFAPPTGEGRHLLAHEIAHKIQQSGGVSAASASASAPFVVAPPDDPLEAEACRSEEVARRTAITGERFGNSRIAKHARLGASP